jgi:NTP pyrophosphatase (non-canonical NTP hydrolase)
VSVEFQKIIDRAMHVRGQYEAKENQRYGSAWTNEEVVLGFVGDVGDLAKLIMAENGRRNIANSKEKLEHELSDCLWSLIVLSRLHNIDLERSFLRTMDELEEYLSANHED